MQGAALGSVLLHVALLSLPLGGAHKERGIAAAQQIRAFLRPEVWEPPAPAAAAEPPITVEPSAAPGRPPRDELKPAPVKPAAKPEELRKPEPAPEPARAGGAPASTAAIPATFLDPAQLTEHPKPLKEPAVHMLLPMLARGGTARLVLYIDELGRVTSVEVDSATLAPAAVDRAVAIFSAIPFSPGRVDGMPVKAKVRITVGAEERPKE